MDIWNHPDAIQQNLQFIGNRQLQYNANLNLGKGCEGEEGGWRRQIEQGIFIFLIIYHIQDASG